MSLLQRYVLSQLLRVFGFVVFASTLLLVFVGVYGQAREHGLGPWQIFQILPFVAPTLLPFTIPMSLLLSVCMVYGRMSGDREIIAAKSAGIPIGTLLRPSFFLAAGLSAATMVITDRVIPWSVGNIERIVTLAMEDIFLDVLRSQNQINVRDHGISITVMDVKNRTLILPTFRYSPAGRDPITMQAQTAELEFDMEKREVRLNMTHGHIDIPGRPRLWFESESQPFPLPSRQRKPKAQDLQLHEISREMEVAQRDRRTAEQRRAIHTSFLLAMGEFERFQEEPFHSCEYLMGEEQLRYRRLRTEYYNRFSMACGCFFFVLFGSPFSVLMARKQFLTSFLFCFIPILIVYYPVGLMSQNLSKVGQIDPTWAVWLPNAILFVASLVIARLVTRH